MSPAKTSELIEMSFGVWTHEGRRKQVLDGVHIGATWPPCRGDIPAFTPAEAGTRFSDPGGMQG